MRNIFFPHIWHILTLHWNGTTFLIIPFAPVTNWYVPAYIFLKNTDLVAWFQWFLVCASGDKNTHTYMYYMYMYCWEGKIFLWPSKFLLACLRIKLKWDRLTGEKFNFVHKRISHTQEVRSQVRNVKWGIYATLS